MPERVGIRREDKSVWERRVPLSPDHVRSLSAAGIEFVVQPSKTRVFVDDEFRAAGAVVDEDLSTCGVVLAVKEIPAKFFREDGTYVFFSHTIKGQEQNIPMLRRMMELGCQLIDYERVVDEKNRRLIFFGRHAGVAGMIETLVALGRRLRSEGIASPFDELKPPHEYASIQDLRAALTRIGQRIRDDGLPPEITPLTVGLAGYGNVSQGAQEMLDILPTREISPSELAKISSATDGARDTIFKVVFKEEHLVVPKEKGAAFDLQDYYGHPEKYEGVFESYLPHLSVLVNCVYWDARYPRLVTKDYLRTRWKGTPLRIIGDISCDIDGSIEATAKATEPGQPTFVYDIGRETVIDGWEGDGPVIMAVDILPAELPRDASIHFGDTLEEFVPAIARADYGASYESLDLPGPIKRALILHRGRLTPDYEYMSEYLP
jgi:saccharopine dehydrogenase (NAD+, L-lysine-forming)